MALAMGLFVTGCQSSGTKPSATATPGTPTTDAVSCDKCKVVWQKAPLTVGGGHSDRVVGYTTRKQMVCPDCRDAVQNMFATGRFEHTCSACGGNMQACATH
jgi:hypothetical protein